MNIQPQDMLIPFEKLRTCNECDRTLPLDQFYRRLDKRKPNPEIVSYYCKVCHNKKAMQNYQNNKPRRFEMGKKWRLKNPEKVKVYKRRALFNDLKKQFGIDYEAEVSRVNGRCEACLQTPVIKRKFRNAPLVVDHDHATGKFRGLLCDPCNMALGLLKDDPARIKSLLDYVMRHTL